jgi:uncharacterized RDD family membrane protein YckC
MLALIAMIIFILGLFKVDLGGLNLLYLGLAFLSAHFVFGGFGWYGNGGWPGRRAPGQ